MKKIILEKRKDYTLLAGIFEDEYNEIMEDNEE